MNRPNFQKEMEQILAGLQVEKTGRKKLLLHSCCGPCSSYVLTALTHFFDIELFYYNPNIHPAEEYAHRLQTQKQLCQQLPREGTIEVLEDVPYDPEAFLSASAGLEGEKEGGRRCEVCFRLRLEKTALEAKKRGADFFTTTLSVSPHKNAALLDAIGRETAQTFGVAYLPADFKKKGGYQQSVALAKTFDLYRQDDCGCIYSLQERMAQKQQKEQEVTL